jgi:hypothetical protein
VRSSASQIVSHVPRHASVTRCRRKSLATFLGSTGKKSARPTFAGRERRKTLSRDCQKAAIFIFGNRPKLDTIRLDIARADKKPTIPAARRLRSVQRIRHLERRTSHARSETTESQTGHTQRRPAKPVRSPTRRVITARHADDSGRPQEFPDGITHGRFHGALRHGPPRMDFPPATSLRRQLFRNSTIPPAQGGRSWCARELPPSNFGSGRCKG